jgi:hypothetical protein
MWPEDSLKGWHFDRGQVTLEKSGKEAETVEMRPA